MFNKHKELIMTETKSVTPESNICKNSIEFIRSILQNELKNPLGSFLSKEKSFDMSNHETQKIWSFIIVKAFEKDSSFIPLAIHLLDTKFVTPPEGMAKVAALHHIQVKKIYDTYTQPLEEINKIMSEFHFNEGKLVAKNDKVDELLLLYETVFKNSTKEELKAIDSIFDNPTLAEYKKLLPPIVLSAINEDVEGNIVANKKSNKP